MTNKTTPDDSAIEQLFLDRILLIDTIKHFGISMEDDEREGFILLGTPAELIAAINAKITELLVEARRLERDKSSLEYLKVQQFYGTKDLESLIFPDHCSSCHAEWNDGFAEMDDYCCSKAPSNIRDSIMKWHQVKTKDMYDRIAELELQASQPINVAEEK